MAEQQLKVFVSHSHEDDTFCHALVQALRQAGADVWYDEHNMGSGRLGPTIERELRARPAFIVILSPAALRSRWVEDETRWAYGLQRRDPSRLILPITAAPVMEDDIWLFLQDFRRVEAPGWRPLPAEVAVRQTLHAFALTPTGEVLPSTAPEPTARIEDLITRGSALNAQRKFQEALPLFERATQLTPHSFEAWFNFGVTLDGLKRWRESVMAYERATTLNPSEFATWYNKGIALKKLQRYDEALAAFDQTLALDPDNLHAREFKGEVLETLGRYDEALELYEYNFDPNRSFDWRRKARCLRHLGRPAEAEVAERRAKELGE